MITTTKQTDIYALKEACAITGATWGRFNLAGIRNTDRADSWNDVIIAANDEIMLMCKATTDPGKKGTDTSVKGVAHMVEGFHKNAWGLGWHGGKDKWWKHEAFIQVASVPYWRDVDRDGNLSGADKIITDDPPSGLNIHSVVGDIPASVGGWSLGCQVVMHMTEFLKILAMAKKSGGPLFSYNLMRLKSETKYLYNMVHQG